MADIVISEFMDEEIVKTSLHNQDYIFDPGLVDRPEELMLAVSDAQGVIVRNRTQVRGELLQAAKRLQVVGRLGVGLDNIDLVACEKRGIRVCPATGANDLSVAEYVITATLMLLRGAWLASDEIIQGGWPRSRLMGREMNDKQMGLIGFGAIAQETATRARALGMKVCACDPYLPEKDPRWQGMENITLPELLKTSDVVSLHVPLTDETSHMIDAAEIAMMQDGAILINAARGGIVNEKALVEALKNRMLGGAALDVFATEPVTNDSGSVFKDVPGLILTPHIAGVTKESNIRVSQLIIDKVLNHLKP